MNAQDVDEYIKGAFEAKGIKSEWETLEDILKIKEKSIKLVKKMIDFKEPHYCKYKTLSKEEGIIFDRNVRYKSNVLLVGLERDVVKYKRNQEEGDIQCDMCGLDKTNFRCISDDYAWCETCAQETYLRNGKDGIFFSEIK